MELLILVLIPLFRPSRQNAIAKILLPNPKHFPGPTKKLIAPSASDKHTTDDIHYSDHGSQEAISLRSYGE